MKNFQNRSRVLVLALVFIMSMSTLVSASRLPMSVYLKDRKLDTPVAPVTEKGRTLLPMRYVFEEIGADVDWDQKRGMALASKGDMDIALPIGKDYAFVNGKRVSLDVGTRAIKGRTLVPVRFASETLGLKAGWDNNTKSVLLDSKAPFGNYKVTRVVDGDTIKIMFNGKEESLRLIGVDTPESVHPDKSRNTKEGKIASDFAKKRLEGKTVAVEFDIQERDHYGRLLGYVYQNGQMFNKVLLEEGYGRLATYPPNTKYVDDFRELEKAAREKKAGFWSNGFVTTKPEIVVPKDGKYIGSLNSDKYHLKGCRWEKKIKYENRIGFKNKQDAINHGYKACGTCKP